MKIVVTLCTRQRPKLLESCLIALAAQEVPKDVSVSIVVVENDHADTCRDLVEKVASLPGAPPIVYCHEPKIGIPFARNRTLELALAQAPDWIANTDDDAQPNPDWLAYLVAAQARFDADVVYGNVEYTYPKSLPPYAFPTTQRLRNGQRMERAGCGNVMFAAYLVRPEGLGLRFADHLAHGEDTDFFYRAHKAGARIIYSANSVVAEVVPRERLTLGYQAKRKYYYVASYIDFLRRYRGLRAARRETLNRLLFHTPEAIFRMTTAPLFLLLGKRHFRKRLLKGTSRLTATAGAIAGLWGFRGNPYKCALPEQAAASASTMVQVTRIPKKLHMIWIGDDDKRPDRWIDTWRANHPDWEFRLWNNDDLRDGRWETKRQMEIMAEEGAWSGVANLMRYEILYRYGGVYADSDSESVRPLDDWLLDCQLFAVWENEVHRPGLIANTFIGSVPGHKVFRRLMEEIVRMKHPLHMKQPLKRFSLRKGALRKHASWKTNGPVLFTRVLSEFGHDAVTVLPSSLFLPEHFAGHQERRNALVYARHYWGTTMQVKGRQGGYELARQTENA